MVLNSDPVFYIVISLITVFIVIALHLFRKNKCSEKEKKIYFIIITVVVILSTLYLAGSTVYENITSETSGPVHWHADYKVIVCGEKLDLVNRGIFTNKAGSPLLHGHGDERIHIEGTVKELSKVSLSSFFMEIGGELESGNLVYQTHEGSVEKREGDSCNGEISSLKVYVNGNKIEDYENYIIYPASSVPPGDCIVILFDETNEDTTEITCESWEVNEWNYDSFSREDIKIGKRTWQ